VSSASIPNRPAFRAQEVCEIASVQPYVLRGWEAEFPNLGVAKTAGGPRVYRRADVERVLRLKHLIQVEGLTLSGARRRLEEEGAPDPLLEVAAAELETSGVPVVVESAGRGARSLTDESRAHLREVRQGLQWILQTLDGGGAGEFALAAETGKVRKSGSRKIAK
jgi:DNA-binding transcriptional MerR regulator